MRNSLIATAACLSAVALTSKPALALPAQASESGTIRICRYPPNATGIADHKSVPIPAGTGFTSGDDQRTGDQLKPYFLVVTTKAVVLPPKPGCVTAPAAMKENPEHFHLTTRYPTYLPSQLDVPGLEAIGRVAHDFSD